MKQFQKQLQSKAKSVKLTAAERRDVKERLQAYMEYHPLPAELRTQKARSAKDLLRTEPFAVLQIPFGAIFKTAGVALAVILLVVPFAAERAVPGDTLYAVKVQFNEEVRGTLIFDGTEKIEWETERVNRRIAEARLLASEGRLTEAAEAEVAAAVKEHTETAQKEIAELRAVDADEAAIAAISLDTTLEAQASTLDVNRDDDVESSVNRSTALIASVINESRSQNPDTASSTPPSFEKLMARLEQNTTRIFELRESLNEIAAADRLVEVDRRISDISRTIEVAIAAFETDDTGARQQLVDALQRSQKLIIFMTEIETVETVDIETVVPVILTPDEKTAIQQELLAELVSKRAQIANLLEVEENDGVAEKATVALEGLDAALLELASTSAYLVYVERAADAIQLADDTIRSFGDLVSDDVPEPIDTQATTTDNQATTTDVDVLPDAAATTTLDRASSSEPLADAATSSVANE